MGFGVFIAVFVGKTVGDLIEHLSNPRAAPPPEPPPPAIKNVTPRRLTGAVDDPNTLQTRRDYRSDGDVFVVRGTPHEPPPEEHWLDEAVRARDEMDLFWSDTNERVHPTPDGDTPRRRNPRT